MHTKPKQTVHYSVAATDMGEGPRKKRGEAGAAGRVALPRPHARALFTATTPLRWLLYHRWLSTLCDFMYLPLPRQQPVS